MIRLILDLYIILLIINVILSYIPKYGLYPIVQRINYLANLTCGPIRKILPKDLPFDISPVIVIFLIKILTVLW